MRSEIANFLVQLFFFALLAAFVVFIIAGVTVLAVPIGIAFLIALALSPAVDFLEGLGIPRFFAVVFVFLGLVLAIFLAANLIAPGLLRELRSFVDQRDFLQERVIESLTSLRHSLSGYLPASLIESLDPPAVIRQLLQSVTNMMPRDFGFLGNVVTSLIVTPIITIVFLLQGDQIFHRLMYMVPNRYFEMVISLVNTIYDSIIAYIKGVLTQWCILSVLLCAGFYIIRLPYWPVIGLAAATLNIIPYIGPIFGAGLAATVALMDPTGGLLTPALLVIGLGQLVDNVFIQPVVLAGAVELHPLIAVMAVITLQQYLGVVGMIIAIPLASIVLVSIEIMYRQLKAFGVF